MINKFKHVSLLDLVTRTIFHARPFTKDAVLIAHYEDFYCKKEAGPSFFLTIFVINRSSEMYQRFGKCQDSRKEVWIL